jgi:glucose/arabinose dehydrogenase
MKAVIFFASIAALGAALMPQQGGRNWRSTNVPALYQEACAKCHGDKGQGGGGGTRSLITREKYDQKFDRPFFDAIKNGVPEMGMEAFGPALSDEEIWGLVVYIRELQGTGLRQREPNRKEVGQTYQSQREKFKVEVFTSGDNLRTPWAIDWLPDGRALVTNRPGSVYIVSKDGKTKTLVEGTPEVLELGQGGMMEVAVHPDYAKNGWVYLAYAEPGKNDPRSALTKIVRGKLRFEKGSVHWVAQQTVWEADQKFYTRAGIHFGTRIVFDKGYVFFVVGERGGNMLAQELTNPFGKIHRVKDDGSIPSDNPFASESYREKGALPSIWTYGHRNPQGLTKDLEGNLWDTEHGPRGGDEVNWLQKGHNYGWPVVAFSINYSGTPFQVPWPKPGQDFTLPIFRWMPSTGASGLDVMQGKAFPSWNGDLFAGGLVGQNLDRIRVKNGKLVEHEEVLWGLGRIRDVAVGPDGYVYLVTNEPDRVLRLVPAR